MNGFDVDKIMKLANMTEAEFFAESVGFMLKSVQGLMNGDYDATEFNRRKSLIDSVAKARTLKEEIEKPIAKFPEKGWLRPYLVEGDLRFGTGRWDWWTECMFNEKIEGSIPQVVFADSVYSDPGASETLTHLEGLIDSLWSFGVSDPLNAFVQWLLWGFGSSLMAEEKLRISDKASRYLYEKFELGRMQMHPADYFGYLAAQERGGGKFRNPTAFFPTPMCVIKCMVQMLVHDLDGDITRSFNEPCAGTGSMLLAMSNHTVNMYNQALTSNIAQME